MKNTGNWYPEYNKQLGRKTTATENKNVVFSF